MDMEPDLDSEFYGIGDPDQVLYLTPKEDAKKVKVVGKGKDDGKGKENKSDQVGESKKTDMEASKDKKKCTKPKEAKKNSLKAEQKTGSESSKKGDYDNDDSECMETENQENTKITIDTSKKLSVDDLVVEFDEKDENWEDAFNFEDV